MKEADDRLSKDMDQLTEQNVLNCREALPQDMTIVQQRQISHYLLISQTDEFILTQLNGQRVSGKRANSFWQLKLYCRYLYTRPCMINHIWGLKQLWLKVNGHAWFHLQRLRWPVRNWEGAKNSKWKYMSPAGFELHPASPRQESQRLRPLGHEGLMVIIGLMSNRIMGYTFVTTRVNLIMVTCVFEMNVRLSFHFLSHCRF